MTSDNPKDELLDIFGGNAAKKVEPIDDEYDFGDDDNDLEMVADEEIELEAIEIVDDGTAKELVDEIVLEPAVADEAFSDRSIGTEDQDKDDEAAGQGGGSHWDSLAATLGLEATEVDDPVLEKMFVPPTARAADLEAELSGPPSKK